MGTYIFNGFDEKLDDRFNDKHIELWFVMKAVLPDNDDFLNCTVLESLLEYASSIPLYSEILVPRSSELKDSKQDSLLLVYKNLNFAGLSCTILSILAKVAFSARNRVDTVCRTRFSPYKEGILTVVHFKRELTMSVQFPDFLKLWRQKLRRLKS